MSTDLEKKGTNTSMATRATTKENGDVFEIGDNASAILGEESLAVIQEEKKILRRIDLCLMPLLTLSYMLQFLDKQTLNFASVMGMIQDLSLKGREYSLSSSVFYIGYLVFSYPASILMVRLPLGKYLGCTCLAWAVCLICHAATSNFTGLIVVRFFLGATEASISPGFSLMTGMFYKRSEQPFRHGIWFFGNSLATMFGGLLAYGIAHIQGGLGPWKWLFLIFGIMTLVWAGILLLLLPDTPATARWLSPEQREIAVNRIRSNQTGMKSNEYKWGQVWEAMTDVKVWLLVLYMLANSIPNGAYTTFSSLVVKGLGFSKLQVYLLQLPTGAVHGIFALGSTYLCTKLKQSRCIIAASLSIISLIGSILVRFGPNQGSNLFGVFIFVAYAAGIPITLSMVSSNVAGFTKKAVSSAMVFIAYCAGNIIGPFLFFPSEAPGYASGFLATTICFAAAVVLMIMLRVVMMRENARRDQSGSAAVAVGAESLVLTDQTDKENLSFRYLL